MEDVLDVVEDVLDAVLGPDVMELVDVILDDPNMIK